MQTNKHSRQRGAVLAISLMILLVITLIGVAGLNTSAMEERMAGNSQKLTETFQTAESARKSTFLAYTNKPKTLVGLSKSTTITDRQFTYVLGGNADTSSEVDYVGDVIPINTSLSEDMAAVGIEIKGTGAIANTNIATTTVQGYTVQPVRR